MTPTNTPDPADTPQPSETLGELIGAYFEHAYMAGAMDEQTRRDAAAKNSGEAFRLRQAIIAEVQALVDAAVAWARIVEVENAISTYNTLQEKYFAAPPKTEPSEGKDV